MPKYTTYKSIYEAADINENSRESRTFSFASFLHMLGMPKYRWTRSGATRARLLLFVVIGLFAGTGVVHAFQSSEPAPEVRSVVVSPGDTLWSIAERNKPEDADTRIFIAGIKQKNGLSGSEIYAGDELILPNF
ncbi:LysM peptidoglycan-binding domain-containing protein [Saccharibacillus alkalitolerans]|uniref:LysM peptidoglycan-binding domain-containing protein n=1 Tax=Saccharibacillus alkalitolerans TaxID=2705290 RepID=A0ABX0F0G3_9BACL|nr:LysM peptidoglycan-binding domain-containing protein [Saccharibacillus alkalitolerans]NGZ74483.1 LysM peptidoglycan-binding domain-containing protein [Saccharibacillus alkalitolerans]